MPQFYVTFDEATARFLTDASVRLERPKIQIVRETIHEYHQRLDRLSENERESMLRAFDQPMPAIQPRPRPEVRKELLEVRRARKAAEMRG